MANFVSYSDASTLMTAIGNKFAALGGAYVTKGSSTFASLPLTLTKAMTGYVYNVTDDFTTDARFVEGSGVNQPAGTNVVVVNVGDSDTYTAVTPVGTEDPSEEGWYEESGGTYTLSSDISVDGSKTYYEKVTVSDMKFDVIGSFVDVDPIHERIDKTQTDIAPVFDETETYAVGDVIIYEDELYICTTAHDAGDWDVSDFAKTDVKALIDAAEPDSLTEQQIEDLLALLD